MTTCAPCIEKSLPEQTVTYLKFAELPHDIRIPIQSAIGKNIEWLEKLAKLSKIDDSLTPIIDFQLTKFFVTKAVSTENCTVFTIYTALPIGNASAPNIEAIQSKSAKDAIVLINQITVSENSSIHSSSASWTLFSDKEDILAFYKKPVGDSKIATIHGLNLETTKKLLNAINNILDSQELTHRILDVFPHLQ